MTARKRKSLRDRNVAAIAGEPDKAAEDPRPESVPVEDEPRGTTGQVQLEEAHKVESRPPELVEDLARVSRISAGVETDAPQTAPAATGGPASGRVGTYLTPDEFESAKGAYLADWNNGGDANTFTRWVTDAIEAHARLTPEQRAGLAKVRGRADHRTGASRSFTIPDDTITRMRQAIAADNAAGSWPTASAWCGDAIAAAVDRARDLNRGALPTPPPRLPKLLTR